MTPPQKTLEAKLKEQLLANFFDGDSWEAADAAMWAKSGVLAVATYFFTLGQETGREKNIKSMVDRFLGWKLPSDFHPDCGIHFDADGAKKLNPKNQKYEPVGTNLFTATQAEEMIRYLLQDNHHDKEPLARPTKWLVDLLERARTVSDDV